MYRKGNKAKENIKKKKKSKENIRRTRVKEIQYQKSKRNTVNDLRRKERSRGEKVDE